jgi:homopolymeric O-antigen transport system permease protein
MLMPAPIVIRSTAGWISLKLRDLWEYRELLYFLAWRDIKVRYKQTTLGIIWVVLQPLLIMAVCSIFFGYLARVPSDGLPYPLFMFAGLLPWQLFASALADCSSSLVTNQNLITKIYFPRLVIPIAAVLPRVVDFACAFFVLVAMLFYYGVSLTWALWTLPLFILLAVMTSFAVGLWLSALNVEYRDVRYVVPFLAQFWFFVSPVAYPSSLVPERWKVLYSLNPMVGVVEGFRWALLGKTEAPGPWVAVSLVVTLVLFIGGLYYFRRMEKTFADVV